MVMSYGLLAWVALAGSGAAPSVEEAEKNIVERFNRIQSLTATIVNEESDEKEGKKTSVVITRKVEWKRTGLRFLYRAEVVTKTTQEDASGTQTRQVASTTVSDGERVVRLADQDGTVTAVQRRADVTVTPDMRTMFNELRIDNNLNRLPDVKVGLHDCYAIQLLPKVRKDSDILQTMIYFRKDIGLDVRTVVYGTGNKVLFTSTTMNVVTNPAIPSDRFVIALPDGVELVDETR
jgi:outer membrane lipoprotein-sorting protein